jgi:hypothetical protein
VLALPAGRGAGKVELATSPCRLALSLSLPHSIRNVSRHDVPRRAESSPQNAAMRPGTGSTYSTPCSQAAQLRGIHAHSSSLHAEARRCQSHPPGTAVRYRILNHKRRTNHNCCGYCWPLQDTRLGAVPDRQSQNISSSNSDLRRRRQG